MLVDLGEWLPDQPPFQNPGCTLAKNVIPAVIGYSPYPRPVAKGNALTSRPIGASLFKDKTGIIHLFAGDKTKLYLLNVDTWDDVSGGTYGINTDERWSFARHGNRFFAANLYDGCQEFDFSTQKFAVASTIPKSRHLAEVRNFLVCANIFDSTDGYVPNRIHWSSIGAPTTFPTPGSNQAVKEQSGRQDLTRGAGGITQIVGGQFGTIFFENIIYRMTYVGGRVVFKLDPIADSEGTKAPGSVVNYNGLVFYLGSDGFKMFDSQTVHSIGANKVDQTFFDEYDQTHHNLVSAAIDHQRKLILWAVPVTGHAGRPNKIYVYSLKTKRWSFFDDEVEMLLENGTDAVSLETLGSTYASIDAMPYSLDSGIYAGGDSLLASFGSDKILYNYSGTDRAAVVESREIELVDGQRAYLNRLMPLVQGGGANTVQVGTRDRITDAVTWSAAGAEKSDGVCDFDINGRLFRFRINTSTDFKKIQGVLVSEFFPAGIT